MNVKKMTTYQENETSDFWRRWIRADKEQRIELLANIRKNILENAGVCNQLPDFIGDRVMQRLLNDHFTELYEAARRK